MAVFDNVDALGTSHEATEPRAQDGVSSLILADPHPVTLAGIAHLVQFEADLRVAIHCTTASETVEAVARHPAATLVVDLHLPPLGALHILRQLASAPRACPPIVLLASGISDQETLEALRVGVRGVALKDMAPRLIIECIRRVARGETWIEHTTFAAVIDRAIQNDSRMRELRRRLTRRELQVLGLVAEGLSNKEITERLKIAEGTVKIHLHHIYRKIGVDDRLQLAQYAGAQDGICRGPDEVRSHS